MFQQSFGIISHKRGVSLIFPELKGLVTKIFLVPVNHSRHELALDGPAHMLNWYKKVTFSGLSKSYWLKE